MAQQKVALNITLPAAGDLSSHQYKFMLINSSGQFALAGNGTGIGILQNKPDAAGEAAVVCVLGVSKCVFSGSLTVGAQCASDASGLAEAAASGDMGVCIVVEDGGAANQVGSVLITGAGAELN